ncbi:MAG: hypothetical protein FWH01_16505 [Oscillospiraceae bacterium]|nr:hypothetical protein [Oscillospiraceae bacterium]
MGGSIFEAGMLISFGLAWPASILKSWRSRSAKGKSGVFSMIVILGYICGITHKFLNSRDIVMVFYFINALMVSADLLLWFRNKRLDKLAGGA